MQGRWYQDRSATIDGGCNSGGMANQLIRLTNTACMACEGRSISETQCQDRCLAGYDADLQGH